MEKKITIPQSGIPPRAVIGIIITVIICIAAYYMWLFIANKINANLITASGTIEATQVDIAPKVSGRISEFYKKEGEFVKKGDVLCKIYSPELELALKQANAARTYAKSQYENTRTEFNRIKSLYEQALASKQQFDTAYTAYIGAQSKFEQAGAAAELAEVQLNDTTIYAPINGVLSKKILDIGELVFPGTPIYTLSDILDTWLMIYIPEKDIGKIKYGDKAKVSVDSYPDKKFDGHIVYIAGGAEFTPKNIQTKEERIKQVFGVKISISNEDRSLKPGMPADAEIQI